MLVGVDLFQGAREVIAADGSNRAGRWTHVQGCVQRSRRRPLIRLVGDDKLIGCVKGGKMSGDAGGFEAFAQPSLSYAQISLASPVSSSAVGFLQYPPPWRENTCSESQRVRCQNCGAQIISHLVLIMSSLASLGCWRALSIPRSKGPNWPANCDSLRSLAALVLLLFPADPAPRALPVLRSGGPTSHHPSLLASL